MFSWNFDDQGFVKDPNLACSKQIKYTISASQNGTLFVYAREIKTPSKFYLFTISHLIF